MDERYSRGGSTQADRLLQRKERLGREKRELFKGMCVLFSCETQAELDKIISDINRRERTFHTRRKSTMGGRENEELLIEYIEYGGKNITLKGLNGAFSWAALEKAWEVTK